MKVCLPFFHQLRMEVFANAIEEFEEAARAKHHVLHTSYGKGNAPHVHQALE